MLTDWRNIKKQLLAERAEILHRMNASGDYGLDAPMSDELGELSLYDNHPADIGSELFERGKDLALRDNDKLMVQEIDRALQAMADGRYGICEACGRPIARDRLQARPSATLCADCKRMDERQHPDRDRPIEEEFLAPGFARTDTDGQDVTAFDGEDSWQAVERYNRRSDEVVLYEESCDGDDALAVDPIDRISNTEYRNQLPSR